MSEYILHGKADKEETDDAIVLGRSEISLPRFGRGKARQNRKVIKNSRRNKDKAKAYVVGERFRGVPCDHDRVLKLRGLDESKTYTVRELNVTASGAALMGAGLFCPRLPDCGSWVWHIGEV